MTRTSIADAVTDATRTLHTAGIPSARREATAIWADLACVPLGEVWLRGDDVAEQGQCDRFRIAIRQRSEGEPRCYVVAAAGFRKLDLSVDRRVLIPRPETESLVGRVLDWARSRWGGERWGSAADIGTGSGCIALSLACEGWFSRIVATDRCANALQVAAKNVAAVSPRTPVELRSGHLLDALEGETFDVIVSNPPYLTEAEYESLGREIRDYEPREALVGGSDGLHHLRELFETAMDCLNPGGLIAFELDSTRAERTLELAIDSGWGNARIESDPFGRSRYIFATRESR